jgi:hypothetical protein
MESIFLDFTKIDQRHFTRTHISSFASSHLLGKQRCAGIDPASVLHERLQRHALLDPRYIP